MLFLTDNSSRQANQNKLLLDTVKYSSLCCFTRCCGIIDLGSLTQVPRDLFLPFGGFLSTFCLQDNSEVVGLHKQSKTNFTVADASEISELGVKGAGNIASITGYTIRNYSQVFVTFEFIFIDKIVV